MKKIFRRLFYLYLILQTGCAANQKFVQETPEAGKALVVGAVLVENDGIEDVYAAHKGNIDVVIVGKHMENGEEVIEGYRVKTDENGYYLLQNVPPGSYVVKGFEVDLAFSTRMIITSRWEGTTQIYYPIDTIIDNNVRYWPPAVSGPVIDMGIQYFRIDASKRIFDNKFKSLKNRTLGLPDHSYTMPDPAQYFEQKYPEWGWFN